MPGAVPVTAGLARPTNRSPHRRCPRRVFTRKEATRQLPIEMSTRVLTRKEATGRSPNDDWHAAGRLWRTTHQGIVRKRVRTPDYPEA